MKLLIKWGSFAALYMVVAEKRMQTNYDTRSTVQKEENLNLSSCLHVNRSLVKHIQRASYETRIWKMSLINYDDIISPDGHGWRLLEEDGKQCLEIDWFDCKPAPDEVRITVLFIKMVYHINFN